MADGYRRQRNTFGNYSGSRFMTPLTQAATLIPALTGSTIYLQRLFIYLAAGAPSLTWAITDGAGEKISGTIDASTSLTKTEIDFGHEGLALTPSQSLVFTASGTGAAGSVTWDAYKKINNTVGFGS